MRFSTHRYQLLSGSSFLPSPCLQILAIVNECSKYSLSIYNVLRTALGNSEDTKSMISCGLQLVYPYNEGCDLLVKSLSIVGFLEVAIFLSDTCFSPETQLVPIPYSWDSEILLRHCCRYNNQHFKRYQLSKPTCTSDSPSYLHVSFYLIVTITLRSGLFGPFSYTEESLRSQSTCPRLLGK